MKIVYIVTTKPNHLRMNCRLKHSQPSLPAETALILTTKIGVICIINMRASHTVLFDTARKWN